MWEPRIAGIEPSLLLVFPSHKGPGSLREDGALVEDGPGNGDQDGERRKPDILRPLS